MVERPPAHRVLLHILNSLRKLGDLDIPKPDVLPHGEEEDREWALNIAELAGSVGGLGLDILIDLLVHSGELALDVALASAWLSAEAVIEQCSREIDDCEKKRREKIISVLGHLGGAEFSESTEEDAKRRDRCVELIQPFLSSSESFTRSTAALALARCRDEGILADLEENPWELWKSTLIRIISLAGRDSEWIRLAELVHDPDWEIKNEALDAMRVLGDRVGMSEAAAEEILAHSANQEESFLHTSPAGLIAMQVARNCPAVYEKTIRKWAKSPKDDLRRGAALSLRAATGGYVVPTLEQLALGDLDSETQIHALNSLEAVDEARCVKTAMRQLKDRSWRVRRQAVALLGFKVDKSLFEIIRGMVNDPDENVRQEALRALEPLVDDPRVLSSFLTSLNDPDARVRRLASKLLRKISRKPSLPQMPNEDDSREWWAPMMAELKAITQWGEKTGRELLGKKVRVIQYRQGLGRTANTKRLSVVDLEISDTPLMSGYPHGGDVMRGLILHELGHHLFDIGQRGQRTMEGIATSEGVRSIFNILMDERLERKMRSRNPAWGVYFDRLAAYAFSNEEKLVSAGVLARLQRISCEDVMTRVQAGDLPGRLQTSVAADGSRLVAMAGLELLSVPGLHSPLMLFLTFLRCRHDLELCPDPKVIRSIELIPGHFRNLTHAQMLALARKIGDLIGRDDVHRKNHRRLAQLLQKERESLRVMQELLDRMAEAGVSPENMMNKEGGGGIPVAGEMEGTEQAAKVPGFAQGSRLGGGRRGLPRLPGRWSYDPSPEESFIDLYKTKTLDRDLEGNAKLVRPLVRHIRILRPYLERLGITEVVEHGFRRGTRLDRGALPWAMVRHSPDIFLHRRLVVDANCYIGILIDRSGSMKSGGKMERARAFAALVAESAAGLPGLTGHVNAFDDDTFFRLGTFARHAIGSLESGGGNNDSGGLKLAAQLALASGRANRLLIMISDGMPTDCSFGSLKALVAHLTRREGIVCAQVAVDKVPDEAFPHSIDLSDLEFDEAVSRFGRLLVKLTADWR